MCFCFVLFVCWKSSSRAVYRIDEEDEKNEEEEEEKLINKY